MPQLAHFDPNTGRVVIWYDTDLHIYKDLPPAAEMIEVPPEQWKARVADPSGWAVENGALVALPPPAAPTGPRYVPMPVIRERVTAAGKWVDFAHAVAALPPDKWLHLLTLAEGVASDDSDAMALLTAIGCDPAAVLAA